METTNTKTTNQQQIQHIDRLANKRQASSEQNANLSRSATSNQFVLMVARLRTGWQSPSARHLWHAVTEVLIRSVQPQPFSPAAWIATNLDLLHPPVPERDTARLVSLSIAELKTVYHTLSTSASTEWQDYVWDTFTELLERELALEA